MANTELEFKEATFEDYTTVAAVAGHTVVTRANGTLGITRDAIAALGTGAITTKGRERQNKAAVAITLGQMLFWDATNLCVTNLVSGQYIGIAAEAAGSGVADIAFDLNEIPAAGGISIYGSSGNFKATYPTIDLAVAAFAIGDKLILQSGDYTLTAAVNITKNQTRIVGIGEVNIQCAADADYGFKIVLGAPAANGDVKFQNLNIIHDDDATQQGILIDNASTTRKIIIELEHVSFEGDGGDSIHCDHTVSTSEIKIYAEGQGAVIEGPVNCTVAHDGDKFRFSNYILRGGVVTGTADKDAELLLEKCRVLHEGVTGGHANQRAYAMDCCTETDADPNVYAGFDTNDFAGSHTEVIWPAS